MEKISDISLLLKSSRDPLQVPVNALANDLTNYAVQKNYVELLTATCEFSTQDAKAEENERKPTELPAASNVYKSLFKSAKHIGVDILTYRTKARISIQNMSKSCNLKD